jgi:hypothetical protein
VVFVSYGHIHEFYQFRGDDFWQPADLTAVSFVPSLPADGSPLAGYGGGWAGLTHINSQQVDFIGTDGHIYELYDVLGSAWTWADLTYLTTGAPSPDGDAPPPDGTVLVGYYYWGAGDSKQVVYTTC